MSKMLKFPPPSTEPILQNIIDRKIFIRRNPLIYTVLESQFGTLVHVLNDYPPVTNVLKYLFPPISSISTSLENVMHFILHHL